MEPAIVTVAGLRIAYREKGSGSPVVLLHGILGDSRAWTPQIEALSSHHRVIAWDAPGCGRSDDPGEEIGFAGYARYLAGFLDALDIESANLAGLSWGGILNFAFYRDFSKRVRSLVLADTYAGWRGSLPDDECEARLASTRAESYMRAEDFVPKWLPGLLTESATADLRNRVSAMMSEFHPPGYRAMANALADFDARDVLGTIDCPTLLVWGEHDGRSPVPVGEAIRDAIAGSRMVVIPGVGHLSNLEAPAAFNDAVATFLAEIDSP